MKQRAVIATGKRYQTPAWRQDGWTVGRETWSSNGSEVGGER